MSICVTRGYSDSNCFASVDFPTPGRPTMNIKQIDGVVCDVDNGDNDDDGSIDVSVVDNDDDGDVNDVCCVLAV